MWNSLLETWTLVLTATLHKNLYLHGDHCAKGARWYVALSNWYTYDMTIPYPVELAEAMAASVFRVDFEGDCLQVISAINKKLMRTSIDTLWDPTKILEYLPKKTKIQIFDRNLDPTFIIETRIKGISVTPWPNDYNWITNQRYKVWTP